MVLRGQRLTTGLTTSTAMLAMLIPLPITWAAAMFITTMVAVTVVRFAPRGNVDDRPTAPPGRIHDDGRASNHWWRTICHPRCVWRRAYRHDAWSGKDRHGQPKGKAERDAGLGRDGEANAGDYGNQTEHMFSFHEGFDEAARDIFDSRRLIQTQNH